MEGLEEQYTNLPLLAVETEEAAPRLTDKGLKFVCSLAPVISALES